MPDVHDLTHDFLGFLFISVLLSAHIKILSFPMYWIFSKKIILISFSAWYLFFLYFPDPASRRDLTSGPSKVQSAMSSVAEETMIASRQILILNSDHAQNHSHQNLLTAHTLHNRKHFSNQRR